MGHFFIDGHPDVAQEILTKAFLNNLYPEDLQAWKSTTTCFEGEPALNVLETGSITLRECTGAEAEADEEFRELVMNKSEVFIHEGNMETIYLKTDKGVVAFQR